MLEKISAEPESVIGEVPTTRLPAAAGTEIAVLSLIILDVLLLIPGSPFADNDATIKTLLLDELGVIVAVNPVTVA
jgi:hypothetical protein